MGLSDSRQGVCGSEYGVGRSGTSERERVTARLSRHVFSRCSCPGRGAQWLEQKNERFLGESGQSRPARRSCQPTNHPIGIKTSRKHEACKSCRDKTWRQQANAPANGNRQRSLGWFNERMADKPEQTQVRVCGGPGREAVEQGEKARTRSKTESGAKA